MKKSMLAWGVLSSLFSLSAHAMKDPVIYEYLKHCMAPRPEQVAHKILQDRHTMVKEAENMSTGRKFKKYDEWDVYYTIFLIKHPNSHVETTVSCSDPDVMNEVNLSLLKEHATPQELELVNKKLEEKGLEPL